VQLPSKYYCITGIVTILILLQLGLRSQPHGLLNCSKLTVTEVRC